jgi:signal transduction histidine kinase
MSRILVVDDRPTNRDLVRTVLSHRGHDVVEADDAAHAFELLRQELPDLIITDVLMPAMDGYEFVRALRSRPATSTMPVIFYSAHYLEEEARPIAEALGVLGVVTKSGDILALVEAVEAALDAAPPHAPPIDDGALDRDRMRVLNAKLLDKIAQLEEKDSIARDLHDVVIQRLFAVGMRLESLRPHVAETHGDRLDVITAEMNETIGDIRNTIHALKSVDGRPDLRVQILQLVEQSPAILGFRAGLHISGPINTLIGDGALVDIVATVREALSNAARHAGASRVDVELDAAADEFVLRICDNGRGLPAERTESGLANLRARAELLGGRMTATSGANGRGTCITWTIPIGADDAAQAAPAD